jgi:MoaA/NifB/PqqE/SkfB family radical SAM enzyme
LTKSDLVRVWGRILGGRAPFLSLEITKECPLRCPGCYAYAPEHLNTGITLRQLSDFKGPALVSAVLALVRRMRPVHLSIIGGEPLVRYRELDELLPKLSRMGVEVQLVTSAVRPIPRAWAAIPKLHLVVSIDGLQPEHDRRRAPATYARILDHIAGHRLVVHCTLTRQTISQAGAIAGFCRFWSARPEVRKIWFSFYTPQEGEVSEERLRPEDRAAAIRDIATARAEFPKLQAPDSVLDAFAQPPQSPGECAFARLTECASADLTSRITPCQLGGRPVCAECGCIASMAMKAVVDFRLAGLVPLSALLAASRRVGALRAPAPEREIQVERAA